MAYNAAGLIQLSHHLYAKRHIDDTNRNIDSSKSSTSLINRVRQAWIQIKSWACPENSQALTPAKQTPIQEEFIQNNQNHIDAAQEYIKQITPPTNPCIIRKKESDLSKTLYFDGKKWYLLLTKCRKQKDTLVNTGGFKRVKYAIDLSTNKRCIVGIIRTEQESENAEITQEIKLHRHLSKIASPEIVKLHTAHQTFVPEKSKWKTYLILEECDKGDLFDRLFDEEDPLTRIEKLGIATDCANGLQTIHSKKFIHRDVKIENIFLYTDEKGDTRAKMGDFGLCCKSSDEEEKKQSKGTARNLSPERAQAFLFDDIVGHSLLYGTQTSISTTTTTQDDIWALGLCFFSLFCSEKEKLQVPNCLNIKQKTDYAILTKIAVTTQEEIKECINEQIDRTAPPALKQLILSMLSVNPKERPSAKVVVETLQKIQSTKTA